MIDVHETKWREEGSSCTGCGAIHAEMLNSGTYPRSKETRGAARLTTVAVGGPHGGHLWRLCDGCYAELEQRLTADRPPLAKGQDRRRRPRTVVPKPARRKTHRKEK